MLDFCHRNKSCSSHIGPFRIRFHKRECCPCWWLIINKIQHSFFVNPYVNSAPVSTKNQYFFNFVSCFSKIGSTKNREFPGFIGEFPDFSSTKTQGFFIIVGTSTCFFSYEIDGKRDLSGMPPTIFSYEKSEKRDLGGMPSLNLPLKPQKSGSLSKSKPNLCLT